jgi:hypothetical protein
MISINQLFLNQAHSHTRGIIHYRHVDEFPNLSKVDNLINLGVDFLFRESQHGAIDVNISDWFFISNRILPKHFFGNSASPTAKTFIRGIHIMSQRARPHFP